MDNINTEYLQRCIETLEKSYEMIKTAKEDSIDYEMYRNSLIKGFEMTLEQCGKLLKKKLLPYFASKKMVEIFHKEGLMVSVWTVNKEKDMHKVLPLGCDNITTRQPTKLIEIKNSKK